MRQRPCPSEGKSCAEPLMSRLVHQTILHPIINQSTDNRMGNTLHLRVPHTIRKTCNPPRTGNVSSFTALSLSHGVVAAAY